MPLAGRGRKYAPTLRKPESNCGPGSPHDATEANDTGIDAAQVKSMSLQVTVAELLLGDDDVLWVTYTTGRDPFSNAVDTEQ